MSIEHDGWPEHLPSFPNPLKFACKAVRAVLEPFHSGVEPYHSTHYRAPLDGDIEPLSDWGLESDGIDLTPPIDIWEAYAIQGRAHLPKGPDTAA